MLNSLLYKLKHFDYTKWSKLFFYTAFTQAIVQVIGLITGILIIRMLPLQEYAYYTIANTMLGTMTLLSDGGVTTGVMAIGGEVWQDKKKLGSVLATGMVLRKKIALVSILICSPILIYLLIKNGATWYTSLFIVLALIPSFLASLSDSMLQIIPKLHQDIKPLQQNQLHVSLFRMCLSAICLLISPFTAVTLLANGLPRIYGNIKLKSIARKNIDPFQLPDVAYRIKILKVVRRIMPGAIYYCLSGQITIWLLSIFGNTTSLAQVGALGRITMIFGLLSTIISILIVPRFARMKSIKSLLLKRFFQLQIGLLFIQLIIITFVYFFPWMILWVLGNRYEHLSNELFLIVISSCFTTIAGFSFGAYTSRGWIMQPIIAIFISLIPIVLSMIMFDVSSIKGVLYLNIFTSLIQMTLHSFYFIYKASILKNGES